MIRSFPLYILLACIVNSVVSSSPSAVKSNNKAGLARVDPFVTSAPLIVAVVCSDGVALIALHTAFAEEPLLLDAKDNTGDTSNPTSTPDDPTAAPNTTSVLITDIPRSYRGPFRIYSIDGFGTGMVCAGWRSHAQLVADYCRDLATEELQVYGPPRMTSTHCQEYGRYLAQQTSAWMAYTAILQRHPWSCVGLLATCSTSSNDDGADTATLPGCVWLIDATGAYRVRAHAVGGGLLAGIVNQYLLDRPITPAEETIRDVLDLVSQQTGLVPSGTRVELAVITPDSSRKTKLRRIFLANHFGGQTQSSLS